MLYSCKLTDSLLAAPCHTALDTILKACGNMITKQAPENNPDANAFISTARPTGPAGVCPGDVLVFVQTG